MKVIDSCDKAYTYIVYFDEMINFIGNPSLDPSLER